MKQDTPKPTRKGRARKVPPGKDSYPHGESASGKLVWDYIYKTEDRQIYLRVQKYIQTDGRKTFPQSHWVGDITRPHGGDWVKGPPKGPKIPYYLPQLIETGTDVPLWITEGEKDADTLTDIDLLATTNSEGAGNWTADLNRWFEGRKTVYVLEDNDAPGRKHAVKVARNLVDIVDEVRIVRFPDVPEGEDVTYWLDELKHTKAELLERAEAARVFSKKTTIAVVPSEVSRVLDDLMAAMRAAELPVLKRAGKLVEPIWDERPAAKGRKTKVVVLNVLTVTNLKYMINKHAVIFTKYDKREKDYVPIGPPDDLLLMLLQLRHAGFPNVVGTISAPTMRPDGSILSTRGYDEETQLWYDPDKELVLPEIDNLTKEGATAALAVLKGLLVEVAFSKENNLQALNRSVALAAILTAVLRGAFELAPLFLFRAHVAGTGKSFLVDLIALIVNGRKCPVITAHSTTEEMEKRLGALLLEGPPLISIDNLSINLKGDLIAQMVERPTVKIRILGKSEMPECEWRGMLFATGNNINLVGDLTRRGLICNLDRVDERPELWKYEHDPLAMVLADRGKYIAAALTIAKAYMASGERVACKPLGSFGDWSKAVREPLMWLGEEDPVKSMDQARTDDPERAAVQELITEWKAHLGTEQSYKSRAIIDIAKETKLADNLGLGQPDWERVRPDFYTLLVDRAGNGRGEIEASKFGKWLRDIKGQVHIVDEKSYRIVTPVVSSGHGNLWRLEEVER